MKATLFIKDYKIDNVDAEIYYSDVMDGTADTMSVSFIHENDLTKEFNLKTKAEILIEDNVHSIFESGWIMENALYVEGEEVGYLIEGNFVYDIRDPKTLVGAIDYINKTARINEKLYIFDEIGDSSQDLKKPLYLDNRKRYYMCLSQITSNLNSLSANNGYYIYMTLKEQSVLLKDCMRSDCAITPSLYPQFPTQELEVNNLFTFEEKEYYDEYEEMSGGIKITQFKHSILIDGENMFPLHVLLVPVNIPAGTYSYNNIRTDKDFSFVKIDNETYIRTYSVPSYEYSVGSTGTITFEQDIEYIEVQFSTYAVFDNDVISWEIYDPTTIKVSETKFEQIYPTLYEATCKVCDRHNMQLLNDKINVIDDDLAESLKKVSCPNLTYKDLSTFDQLYDIFVRIGRMPYFENNTLYGIKLTGDYNDRTDEFENKFLKSSFERAKLEGINQNVYSTKVYNNVYDEELVTVPTIFTSTARQKYTTVSTKYKNTSDTDDTILAWYNDQLYDWTRLDSRTDQDSKRLLGISNFNDLADGIEDARAYGITLPSNIQYVHSIYKVVPYCRYNSIDRTYEFGFKKSPIGVTINNKN